MAVNIDKFRKVINKHIKFDKMNPPEKLEVVYSDTGSYAYLSECVADNNPANFKGLTESEEGGTWISPGDKTYTINYDAALIAFASTFTIPNTLYAHYWGGGSVIWAEDVTDLQEACNTIHDNALYKDGSVALEGNLNLNGHRITNVTSINNVVVQTHKHLGTDVDGTLQLSDDSISALSISKVTNLQSTLNNKQDKLPTYQSGKYLTNNGSVLSWGAPYTRNIGEVVQSILPLNDSKLHLLDGSLLDGTQYTELYNYLSANATTVNYPSGVKITGDLQNNNGVLSGFSETAYADIPVSFTPGTQDWEVQLKLELSGNLHGSRITTITADGANDSNFYIYIDNVRSQASYSGLGFYIQFDVLKTDGSRYTQSHYQNTAFPSGRPFSDLTQVKWLRYGYSNSTFYMKCSTDGVNFTTVMSNSIPDLLFYSFTTSFVRLGRGLQNTSYLSGKIDLNDCYIKYGEDIIWQGGISFSRAESDFLTEEEVWQSTQEYFNACGKFVLDMVNQTVRLPYIRGIIQGTVYTSNVGLITPAGLPNITGSPILGEANSSWSKMPPIKGAIYRASTGENKYAGASDSDNDYLAFDASRSNPIYGRSNTVQPQTIRVLNYMVVSK